MHHQLKARQIDAASGNVGCDADAGAAVAHGLQRMGALVLAEFAREGDDRETAIVEPRRQMIDGGTRRAEDDGVARLIIAEHVDDGVFPVVRHHGQRAVVDINMLLGFGSSGDADGVALVVFGELGDRARHGRGKHQGAALGGRGFQNEFQILAEAEIEHLVGLVENDGAQLGNIERVAANVVAEAAGRADDDVGAAFQCAPLGTHVHAADAGGDRCTGQRI